MSRLTAAQRANKRYQQIWDYHNKNRDYWKIYEARVRALEEEGLTRSDAQGVVDAEDLKAARLKS